jgi:tetratricopeptide (TPR) repeat protein
VQPARGAAERATAIAHFERASLLAPDNPFLYRSRAVLGLTAPESLLPDVLRAAREAVRREPRLLPELVERLRVVGLRLEQWRDIAGPSAIEQLELGVLLESRHHGADARQIYEGAFAIASERERPLVIWRLASLLVAQGEAGEALRHLDVLDGAASDHPELHLVRARALALRDAPAALDAYQRAVAAAIGRGDRSEPDAPLVVDAASRARLAALGLDLSPHQEPARYRRALAQYLLDRGEWETALREWSLVAQASPRDAEAHHARGLALERLARPDPALEAFRQAVAADGQQARFRLAFAARLWQADRYHEAAAEWRRARDLDPADAQIRLVLARAYLRLGQRDAARREFGEAMRLAPSHPDVRQGFAALGPLSISGR